ncbi:hypothetical protein LAZ67_7002123 [Cordylochernes scorpioides]|uniref:Uncharacterized protein n=1 Tax=Cordylochernes scorpioides TaxID=51811 RepID=A0ABY6KMU5_9ARAC|nr:hypothetical protein LAZ67_7002123 [Cordylochernes scorpioides]
MFRRENPYLKKKSFVRISMKMKSNMIKSDGKVDTRQSFCDNRGGLRWTREFTYVQRTRNESREGVYFYIRDQGSTSGIGHG